MYAVAWIEREWVILRVLMNENEYKTKGDIQYFILHKDISICEGVRVCYSNLKVYLAYRRFSVLEGREHLLISSLPIKDASISVV